ncbi:hypothetical protein [Salmonella enterica]|uniref:hypothetical protein n=1 Tax=Salmonella enterica TaxID=28901 RepID=UPI0015FEC57C|nr:hypothetical protein [Salmonella enterica]
MAKLSLRSRYCARCDFFIHLTDIIKTGTILLCFGYVPTSALVDFGILLMRQSSSSPWGK